MTTRRNQGGRPLRRRNIALRALEAQLKSKTRTINGLTVLLKPKDEERIEAEIEILKHRGATS